MKGKKKRSIEEKTFIVGDSDELRKYAQENSLPIYNSYKEFEKEAKPKENVYGFTRKSILGALYRVGASFTLDAMALTAQTGDMQGFLENLDAEKLLRVAGFVVLINFADYKWDITNKLNKSGKTIENYFKKTYSKINTNKSR